MATKVTLLSEIRREGRKIFTPNVLYQGRVGALFGAWNLGGDLCRGFGGDNLSAMGGLKGCCIGLVKDKLTIGGRVYRQMPLS